MYEIDRKAASKLLKMSIRTVDRYIAKNRLSIERRDGRIWLDKKEVLKLRQQKRVDSQSSQNDEMSIDNNGSTVVDRSIDSPQDGEISQTYENSYQTQAENDEQMGAQTTVRTRKSNGGGEVYKKLFEELQLELKQKQDRLELANYRVGQLEAQLKDTVPLLDYNHDLENERLQKEELTQNITNQQVEIERAKKNLKDEKFNKFVYLIIIFLLLMLQPLWFIFQQR